MFGWTESATRGMRSELYSLAELATLLVPDTEQKVAAATTAASTAAPVVSSSASSSSLMSQASLPDGPLALGSLDVRGKVLLVQGPAGCGKSLFAWSLYCRFGTCASASTTPDHTHIRHRHLAPALFMC